MAKSGRIYVNQSVSFPPALLAVAKKRAANLGLPFSAYVQKCVERDLAERQPIVFHETVEPAAAEDAPHSGPRSRR
ncbi:MAG: hypothetical protein ACREFX_11690 [Opitutaceae bacterium]